MSLPDPSTAEPCAPASPVATPQNAGGNGEKGTVPCSDCEAVMVLRLRPEGHERWDCDACGLSRPVRAGEVVERVWATRAGRWGVHQFLKGKPTGGGTVGMGWATEQEAREQNRPSPAHGGGVYTYEPFERAL